jgi:hypothetical protein
MVKHPADARTASRDSGYRRIEGRVGALTFSVTVFWGAAFSLEDERLIATIKILQPKFPTDLTIETSNYPVD